MSELVKEYEKLTEQRKKIEEELKPLEESETVKRYLELKRQSENLYNQQLNILKVIEEKYSPSNNGISVMVKMINNTK